MDWQALINQFEPLERDAVLLFAPPRDMDHAINTFNRAVRNIGSDSMDVALIALRKLTATYPMFGQAALLLGCCQASAGQYDEALEQFEHALLSGLPDHWQERARIMRDGAAGERQNRAQIMSGNNGAADERSHAEPQLVSPAVVLEKARRSGRVRMASEREKQAVIRQGEFPEEEQTRVRINREPVEYLRLAVPAIIGLAVVGLLIYAGAFWLPGLIRNNRNNSEAAARLAWLSERLDQLSDRDAAVAELLEEYRSSFAPAGTAPSETSDGTAAQTGLTSQPTAEATATTSATTTATPETTATTVATTAATTSATTTPSTAGTTQDQSVQALQEANRLYQEAQAQQSADLKAAGNALLAARSLLAAIPGQTAAPGVTGDAATLSGNVEALISLIARDAAESFRVAGMAEFDQANYRKALDEYFLKAYGIYPQAYGGGVAYYCGRCYQMLEDRENARIYYDYVIAHFPGRDIAASAASRLSQMGY